MQFRNIGGKMEKSNKPVFKKWWFWVIIVVVILGIGAAVNQSDQYEEYAQEEVSFNETDVCLNARRIVDDMNFEVMRDHTPPAGIALELVIPSTPTLEQMKAITQNIICEREISGLATDLREDNSGNLSRIGFYSERFITIPGIDNHEQRILYGFFSAVRGETFILWNDNCIIDNYGNYADESCVKREYWQPVLFGSQGE